MTCPPAHSRLGLVRSSCGMVTPNDKLEGPPPEETKDREAVGGALAAPCPADNDSEAHKQANSPAPTAAPVGSGAQVEEPVSAVAPTPQLVGGNSLEDGSASPAAHTSLPVLFPSAVGLTVGGSQGEELECPAAPSAPSLTPDDAPATAQFQVSEVSSAPLRVYSWQRRRVKSVDTHTTDANSQGIRPPSPIQKLNKVCKPVESLLPLPMIQKRRRKLPRRSCRVAGAGPCSPGPMVTDAQKRVMRQLGFSEREVIEPEAQDRYCKLYNPLLSESHVSAIAAIFGWTVGDGEQV